MKTTLPLLTIAWMILVGIVFWQQYQIRQLHVGVNGTLAETKSLGEQIRLQEKRLEFVTNAFSDSANLSFEPLKISK